MNYFKFDVTNDYTIKEKIGYQSDISEALDDCQTAAHTNDNRIWPSFMASMTRKKNVRLYNKNIQLTNSLQHEIVRHFSGCHYVRKLANNDFV